MNPELTQPSLLSRVRDPANHQAWRDFESRYRDLIVRFCRNRGIQQADAEDIVQITMAKLVKCLQQFIYDPQRGRFRDYLYRIVRSAISEHLARPKTGAQALDTSMLAALPDQAEPAMDSVWTQEWVNHHYRMALEAVRQSFEPRSIDLYNRSIRGESVDQLAEAFGMTTQAVHKVRQRIRARLQELIQQQVRDEESVDG